MIKHQGNPRSNHSNQSSEHPQKYQIPSAGLHFFVFIIFLNDIKFNLATIDFATDDIKDEKLKDFAMECNKLKLTIYDEALREKVSYLFKNLVDNVDEFYKQVMNEFAEVPIFQKYEMSVLYDKLRLLSNYDLYNFISVTPYFLSPSIQFIIT